MWLLQALGTVIVVLGLLSLEQELGRRMKWGIIASVALIALGCFFLFSGLLAFNPELRELWEVGQLALALLGGSFAVAKAVLWAITRADFYWIFTGALRSVLEIKESVRSMEKAATAGKGSSKGDPERAEKWRAQGARPLAGLVGGGLLGWAVAGSWGAIVGALIVCFLAPLLKLKKREGEGARLVAETFFHLEWRTLDSHYR